MPNEPGAAVLDNQSRFANEPFHPPADKYPTSDPAAVALLTKADDAAMTLRRGRYTSLFDYEGANTAALVRENPELLSDLLKGWSYSFDEFMSFYRNPSKEEFQRQNRWDRIAFDLARPFEDLVSGSLPKARWEDPAPLTSEEIQQANDRGYGAIDSFLGDEAFPASFELTKMLLHDMGIRYRQYAEISKSHVASDYVQRINKAVYDKRRMLALPLLEKGVKTVARQQDTKQLKEIFENLVAMQDAEGAQRLLFSPVLTEDERMLLAVAYANTFGFINAIDAFSNVAHSEQSQEGVKLQAQSIYQRMEGEEVKEIIEDLSRLYKEVDFHQYALNSKELTQREIDMLDSTIQQDKAERADTVPSDYKILDIGAGTGRHAIGLGHQGHQGVVALEREPHHVAKIHEQEPAIKVVQGDWDNLPEVLWPVIGNGEKVQFAYSCGRTVSHNRRPVDMFHMFDGVRNMLDEQGDFVFDQPDVDWGVYRNRIDDLKKNLEAIGVDTFQGELIYDGPDEAHKFNRMVLRPEQIDALAALLGFKRAMGVEEVSLDGGNIRNLYYHFEVDPAFSPEKLSRDELGKHLATLRLLAPGINFNTYIKTWGMTIGQALMFGLGNHEQFRKLNEVGEGPEIFAEPEGNTWHLSTITRGNLRSRPDL